MLKDNSLQGVRIGYGMAGSFCTFEKSFMAAEQLRDMGAELLPIMSFNAALTDTRFGKGADHRKRLEKITGRSVIDTIEAAEPIGPKQLCDILVVAPCTANTAAKLALGITDTPLTMAVKSHLRGGQPVVIALATNDGLAGCAKNLGALENYRHYYFVPYRQDDHVNKPASLVADFGLIPQAITSALEGRQLQAVLIG